MTTYSYYFKCKLNIFFDSLNHSGDENNILGTHSSFSNSAASLAEISFCKMQYVTVFSLKPAMPACQ